MSEPSDDPASQTADMRKHPRIPESGQVSMFSEEQRLSGSVSNVSDGGVMYLSGESLRVTVEIEQEGNRSIRTGRLVRVQRVNSDETAYAVEFDTE